MLLLALAVLALSAATDLDSDGDGLSDFHERHKHRTDPHSADSDGDGVPDGDWRERRESTYVVRSVVEVLRPVTPEHLVDDFQDARVLRESEDRVELEVLHYPFSTAPEALGTERARLPVDAAERARWLEPGPTSDHDAELRDAILTGLAEAGIDTSDLDDPKTVERVARWLLARAEHHDGFTTFATAFDDQGRPFVPEELAPHVNGGRGATSADWARELSARGMFAAGVRGSCTSSAVYLSGCLRAVGIPTRTVLCIPLFDAGDEREWALARERIRQPLVRRTLFAGMRGLEGSWASHTFNEVLLGGRWWRLDYAELGVGILRRERFGLLTHVATFHDWADARAAATIGRRQCLGLRDAVLDGANPYSALILGEELGPHCTLELPEPQPLRATIAGLRWSDDPKLPADVRAGLERRAFGLVAELRGVDGLSELQELLALQSRRVFLEAEGHPRLGIGLDPGCCWWRAEEELALVHLPFGGAGRRDLRVGVPYRPRLAEEGALRFGEDLVVLRERPLPDGDEAPARGDVRGVVRDERGEPVRARVAAVFERGSISYDTDDEGRFRLMSESLPECFALHASTAEGRVAVRADVRPGSELELTVRPGATLRLVMDAPKSCRCAVFRGGERIEDFTLRPEEEAEVVVPAGEVELRLYAGDEVLAERKLELAVGEERALRFELARER